MSPVKPNPLSLDTARFRAGRRRVRRRPIARARAQAMTLSKMAAGLLSGVAGVLSEAARSAPNLVARTLAFLPVRLCVRTGEQGHACARGQRENLSTLPTIHPEPMTHNLR